MKQTSSPPLALPSTLMAQAALTRVVGVSGFLVVLWLAIWWAVSQP